MNAQQIHRLRIRTRKLKAQNRALSKQASPAFGGGPLTKKQADDLVRSTVTTSKFGTVPQQDLQRQAMASDLRQGQTHDWFGQYIAQVNAAKESQAQAQAAAVSQIRGDQGTAQASDQGAQAKRDEVAAQLAKLTGGNFDSGRSTEAAAESNRKALGDINVAQLAKTGAADTTYLGNRAATGAAYETRAHLDEAGRKRKLEADLGTMKALAGEYGNEVRDKLRTQDFNNQIAQSAGLVKQQQLGLNAELASSLIGSRGETAKNQRRQARIRRQQLAETTRSHRTGEQLAQERIDKQGSKAKGHKGPTHTQKVSAQEQLDSASALINTNPAAAKKAGFVATYHDLIVHHHIKPTLAHAATERFFNGRYLGSTVSKVRKHYGIKLHNPTQTQATQGQVTSILPPGL